MVAIRSFAKSGSPYGRYFFGKWRNETSINECIVLVVSHLPAVSLPSLSHNKRHTLSHIRTHHPNQIPSYLSHTKYLPPPFSSNSNDTGGSVHDSSWADLFMEKVGRGGRSRSPSESKEDGQGDDNADENATPSRKEKVKQSGSANNLFEAV